MKIKLTKVYVTIRTGAAVLHRGAGVVKKTDVSQGPFRWLTVTSPERAGRCRAAARSERQPRGQRVSAGPVSTGAARGDVLYGRRARRSTTACRVLVRSSPCHRPR